MVEGRPTRYRAGQLRSGRVTRVAEFGPFVELEPGVDGLIPLSESGVARGGDIKKAFPVGTEIQVVVLEVDAAARRIRLSVTAVEKMREGDEVREYTERTDVGACRGIRIARRQAPRRAHATVEAGLETRRASDMLLRHCQRASAACGCGHTNHWRRRAWTSTSSDTPHDGQ